MANLTPEQAASAAQAAADAVLAFAETRLAAVSGPLDRPIRTMDDHFDALLALYAGDTVPHIARRQEAA